MIKNVNTRRNENSVSQSRRAYRPSSAVSKQCHNRTTSQPSVFFHARSSSISKDQIGKYICLATDEYSAIGLSVDELHQIYIAKCEDLGISCSADQERRFFNYCWLYFKHRKFDMTGSGIGCNSAKVIAKILIENPCFAYICLGKNLIKDEGAIEILNSIKKMCNVVHLDISSNSITPEGSRNIFKILESTESLMSLNICSFEGLHRNRLSEEGGEGLSKVLSTNTILSFLDVSGTCLGPEGLNLMLKGLENNLGLIVLNLANNSLGSKAIERLAMVIVSTDLKELNISTNKIGNEGCEFLAQMLSGGYEGYCTVMKIDISDNEITTKGLALLLAAIRINTQLTSVTLKKNKFSNGLSENLTEFLTDNSALETLDLSHCLLTGDGLLGITEGLSKNRVLKNLNFSNNLLKDRGSEIIEYSLLKNKSLKNLDLTSNDIKNKGALALARLMKVNRTLESLILKDNLINDSGGRALSEAVRTNSILQRFSLEHNPLSIQFINEINDKLKHNIALNKKAKALKPQSIILRSAIVADIEHTKNQIIIKGKEKQEAEHRLRIQGKKLECVKNDEREKFEELKVQSDGLRSEKFSLNVELEKISMQMQRVRINGEKQINELTRRINSLVNDIKEAENRKAFLKSKSIELQITRADLLRRLESEALISEAFGNPTMSIISSSTRPQKARKLSKKLTNS